MRNTRRISLALAVCFILSACATTEPQSVQPPAQWGPKFVTPGVQLLVEGLMPTTFQGQPAMTYSLRAIGFQKGKTYALWQRWLDGHTSLMLRFEVNDSGCCVQRCK